MLNKAEFDKLTPNQKANHLAIPHFFILLVIAGILIITDVVILSSIGLLIASYFCLRSGFYSFYYSANFANIGWQLGINQIAYEARTGKSFHKQFKNKEKSASVLISKGLFPKIVGLITLFLGIALFMAAIGILIKFPLFSSIP